MIGGYHYFWKHPHWFLRWIIKKTTSSPTKLFSRQGFPPQRWKPMACPWNSWHPKCRQRIGRIWPTNPIRKCGNLGFLGGSTIRTLLHGRINPKDWQVLFLGDAGFLLFFRVVSGDYGKPCRWWNFKYSWNFHPGSVGKWFPIWWEYYSDGWFNHQVALDPVCPKNWVWKPKCWQTKHMVNSWFNKNVMVF